MVREGLLSSSPHAVSGGLIQFMLFTYSQATYLSQPGVKVGWKGPKYEKRTAASSKPVTAAA